jgi:hypothetical protein
MELLVGAVALAFMVTSALLLVRSVRRGRAIAHFLESKYPEEYRSLGRPRPGYFQSMRRWRFDQFIIGREYLGLKDPDLIEQCERLRRYNLRVLALVVSGFVVLGAILVWLWYVAR